MSSALASGALAVLGGLTQAALIAVWPPRRWQLERDALTKVYASLGTDAGSLATEEDGEVDPSRCWSAGSVHRTEAQARRRPPAYRDWHALPEQIAKTLTALAAGPQATTTIGDLLRAAADMLGAIAAQSRTARRDAEYGFGVWTRRSQRWRRRMPARAATFTSTAPGRCTAVALQPGPISPGLDRPRLPFKTAVADRLRDIST